MTAAPTTTITRTTGFEAYTLRCGYEWATILIRGWRAIGNDRQPRELGEILIHSSFGSWAHQWGHLGVPFKEWLVDCEMEYVAGKFLNSKACVFDGEATLRDLRQSLLDHRRFGDLTKNDARTIWDWIDEHESWLTSSEDDFVNCMLDCVRQGDWREGKPERGARHFLEEPWDRISRTLDRQFTGFWNTFLPAFQAEMAREVAAQVAAQVAV